MFKELANIGNLLVQAQQMSGKMQELNRRLATERVTGEGGGGMVSVELNGLGQVLRVSLDRRLVERQEVELLESLVVAAVNDGITRAKTLHVDAMKSLTEGVKLPGLDAALEQFMRPDGTP